MPHKHRNICNPIFVIKEIRNTPFSAVTRKKGLKFTAECRELNYLSAIENSIMRLEQIYFQD